LREFRYWRGRTPLANLLCGSFVRVFLDFGSSFLEMQTGFGVDLKLYSWEVAVQLLPSRLVTMSVIFWVMTLMRYRDFLRQK
jgi:hypothetical protein